MVAGHLFTLCVFLLLRSAISRSFTLEDFKSLEGVKQELEEHPAPQEITDIIIEKCKLGTLESRLFERFVSLERLVLDFNEILSVANEDFYGLYKLRTLTVKNNGIAQVQNGAFAGLKHLETLDVSNNLITDLNGISFTLTGLKVLRFSNNLITHIGKDVFRHPYANKITIDFGNNRIETLQQGLLSNITGSDLILSGNAIEKIEDGAFEGSAFLSVHLENNALALIDPDAFRNVAVYNELRLSRNKITLQPENFKHLKGLMGLYMDQNEIATIPGRCFEGLKNVNTISLRDNKLAGFERDAFAGLPNLRTLFLGANPIKTLPLDAFAIPTLAFLHVDNCLLDSVDADAFRNVGQVSVLNLGKNKIASLPPNTLYRHLAALKNLYLDNNEIEKVPQDAFVTPGRELTFQYVLLKRNRIESIEAGAFEGVAEIYSLQLQQNRIKRLEKDAFKALKYVHALNLEDNALEDVHDLSQLPPSKFVLLGGNPGLEKTDLPLNELNIRNVSVIGFRSFSYHRVGETWKFVDKPAQL